MKDGKVLVVDDDGAMLWTVQRVLDRHYHVVTADCYAEAVTRAGEQVPDVAVVDIQLNDRDGDGYQLCQRLRADFPEMDVILMTGSISHPGEKLYRSLEKDAFYFLFKPFERRVLRALLERCFRLRSERAAKERYAAALARDLEKARDFQQSLLPRKPVKQAGWHLDGRFMPCDALGGDLYHFQFDDQKGFFFISDIVGHGVSAAMYASMLRSTFDAARRSNDGDPENVLPGLLQGIDFFTDNRFATAVYGQLLPEGRLRYFNAGHPPLYLQRANGEIETLSATGVFLSQTFQNMPRTVAEIRLAPGDRLLAYTDGVYESENDAGQDFGFDGLEQAMKASQEMSVPEALDFILDQVRTFAGKTPITDDVTLLMIEAV